MVSLTPAQFCRSADFHQRQRHVSSMRLDLLARPVIYEVDDSTVLANPADVASPPPMVIKRLGWDRLTLEPEHLTNRIVDAMQRLDAQYEVSETTGPDGDQFAVHARTANNLAMRIMINDDATPGSYRISCTRLSGDTFAYHTFFRKLRDLLSQDNFESWRDRGMRLTQRGGVASSSTANIEEVEVSGPPAQIEEVPRGPSASDPA